MKYLEKRMMSTKKKKRGFDYDDSEYWAWGLGKRWNINNIKISSETFDVCLVYKPLCSKPSIFWSEAAK